MRPRLSQVLTVPVFIFGYDFCGDPLNEITETLEVSAEGGVVELAAPIAREHPFLLINMATGSAASCRVASLQIATGGKAQVGIQFTLPSPGFWGVEFPPERVDHPAQRYLVPVEA